MTARCACGFQVIFHPEALPDRKPFEALRGHLKRCAARWQSWTAEEMAADQVPN